MRILNFFVEKILIILFLFCESVAFSQSNHEKFRKKVSDNSTLFRENLDEAYGQIDNLINEAVIYKDSLSELTLLDRKCRYFYQKNQIDSLIVASESLQKKANLYQDLYSQAMAHTYLAEAYSINNLYDRALTNLDVAYKLLEKDKTGNARIFFAKANVLNSFANVYTDKGEPEKAIEKLEQVIKSYNELKNPEDIKRFQYLNYSNIANLYVLLNLDSAEYYALKSINLKPEDVSRDKVMMMNYYVLGKVNTDQKAYQVALNYYHKAIQISEESGEELNIKEIYSDLIELYNQADKKDSVIFYENKLKEFEISILQSKYNSLQEVIDQNKKKEQKPNNSVYIITGSILIILTLIFVILRRKRENPDESLQEKYYSLIELIKNNDPAFLFSFEQIFPDFSEKLLKINPQLSKSEIEFCALLKLNLSTKEIAKLTFIENRTVQNKKYRIRKRLNIPQSADIYNWFNSF